MNVNVLEQICEAKKDHVKRMKTLRPLTALETAIKSRPPGRGFRYALTRADGPALIAEIKKASPSKGIIRTDFDPVAIARTYAQGGAACLSVLTDAPYFMGDDNDLERVRDVIDLPLLRKDFMIDPYQIFESRALGADCILLIMAALDDAQAREMHDLAKALTMDVLVEVHDAAELTRAAALRPDMIGVNSRNLKTLEVDLDTTLQLAPAIPDGVLAVAESGIASRQDVNVLSGAGYKAFLVGETLMRQQDIAAAIRALFAPA